MKKLLVFIGLVSVLCSTAPLQSMQPPTGGPIEGFERVDEVPPSEQLPAAPLLITAYAFAWVAVFFYVWTIWRRLNKVEAEMRALEKRQANR
jgi:CcmD family protein